MILCFYGYAGLQKMQYNLIFTIMCAEISGGIKMMKEELC